MWLFQIIHLFLLLEFMRRTSTILWFSNFLKSFFKISNFCLTSSFLLLFHPCSCSKISFCTWMMRPPALLESSVPDAIEENKKYVSRFKESLRSPNLKFYTMSMRPPESKELSLWLYLNSLWRPGSINGSTPTVRSYLRMTLGVALRTAFPTEAKSAKTVAIRLKAFV